VRASSPKEDKAGGRDGKQCAAVMTRRSPAPSTTKPRPWPTVRMLDVRLSKFMVLCSSQQGKASSELWAAFRPCSLRERQSDHPIVEATHAGTVPRATAEGAAFFSSFAKSGGRQRTGLIRGGFRPYNSHRRSLSIASRRGLPDGAVAVAFVGLGDNSPGDLAAGSAFPIIPGSVDLIPGSPVTNSRLSRHGNRNGWRRPEDPRQAGAARHLCRADPARDAAVSGCVSPGRRHARRRGPQPSRRNPRVAPIKELTLQRNDAR
jgi:hypothetical protein